MTGVAASIASLVALALGVAVAVAGRGSARLVTFPGLGHLLFWEDPVGFAAVVASFLLDADDTGPPTGG